MPRLRLILVRSTCALGVLCLLLGACRTDGPTTTTNDPSGDDTTKANASGDTSIASPDSTPKPDPPPPAPAPGTAQIRAEITSCDTSATPNHCQVRVEEVLGYGSTTPPLSTGMHTVGLASSLLDTQDAAALDTLGLRTLIVRHAGKQPNLNEHSEAEPPEWTIQSIR